MAAFGVSEVEVGERLVRWRRPVIAEPTTWWSRMPRPPHTSVGRCRVTGGRVTVPGFGPAPLQGDLAFVDLLARMGATVERERGWHHRRRHGPAVGPRRRHGRPVRHRSDPGRGGCVRRFAAPCIRGVGFIRPRRRIGSVRWSPRAPPLRRRRRGGERRAGHPAAARCGARRPFPHLRGPPHGDGFALLGLRVPGVEIEDPDVVAKSLPGTGRPWALGWPG